MLLWKHFHAFLVFLYLYALSKALIISKDQKSLLAEDQSGPTISNSIAPIGEKTTAHFCKNPKEVKTTLVDSNHVEECDVPLPFEMFGTYTQYIAPRTKVQVDLFTCKIIRKRAIFHCGKP